MSRTRVSQCDAVYHCVLQCVTVCCSVLRTSVRTPGIDGDLKFEFCIWRPTQCVQRKDRETFDHQLCFQPEKNIDVQM